MIPVQQTERFEILLIHIMRAKKAINLKISYKTQINKKYTKQFNVI